MINTPPAPSTSNSAASLLKADEPDRGIPSAIAEELFAIGFNHRLKLYEFTAFHVLEIGLNRLRLSFDASLSPQAKGCNKYPRSKVMRQSWLVGTASPSRPHEVLAGAVASARRPCLSPARRH